MEVAFRCAATASSEIGLVGTLFLTSLELFRNLKATIEDGAAFSSNHKKGFPEELESYGLWGSHYEPTSGKLDRIMAATRTELRDGLLSYNILAT